MKNTFRWLPLSVAIAATTVALGGCKLSDLVDDDDRQTVLQGYVADQHGPLNGAKIEIRDAEGISFRTYTNADGRFSLKVDWDDVSEDEGDEITYLNEPVMLRVQHNGGSATGSSYYYSVLCNVIYDDGRDRVNINNITDHVLRQVSGPDDNDSDWSSVADDYCGKNFADEFNTIAAELETDFNFFNSADSGFGNLLKKFADGELNGTEPQQIKNSVGSLSAYPSSGWEVAYEGTVDGEPVGPESTNIGSLSTSPLAAVGALLEELYAEIPSHIDLDDVLEITALNIASDGLGEVGTKVSIALKGKISYQGLSSRFDLVITLNGVDGPV